MRAEVVFKITDPSASAVLVLRLRRAILDLLRQTGNIFHRRERMSTNVQGYGEFQDRCRINCLREIF